MKRTEELIERLRRDMHDCGNCRRFPWADNLNVERVEAWIEQNPGPFNVHRLKETLEL